MKSWLFLLTTLLLVGCTAERETGMRASELIARPFTSEMALTWCGEDYTGTLSRGAHGELEILLTGEQLKVPIGFYCSQGGCTIAQEDLSLTFDEAALPSASLPSTLLRAFVLLPSALISEREEQVLLESGAIQLLCEREDAAFVRLSLERGKIEFINFSFID